MSRQSFSILGAVLPMRRLHSVKQGGVPQRVRVKQAQQQRAISARKEEPQVQNAVRGIQRRGINAGREVRRRATNVGVAALQARSVRPGLLWVNKLSALLYIEQNTEMFRSSWLTAGELGQDMDNVHSLNERVVTDFKRAREEYEIYGRFYVSLSHKAKEYLESKSEEYKKCLTDIQRLILPVVKKVCPTCEPHCCRLSTPERSIYIAGSVGGFDLCDYLLTQCNNTLPDPDYEKAERNLCPFWEHGCTLPIDCRSYLCIQYFCDELKQELNMELISEHLRKIESVLSSFSIAECMV